MNRAASTAIPLQLIARRVIQRGFPELSRRRIAICFGGDEDLMCYRFGPREFTIVVNHCLRGAARMVLEGGIAHELSHILHDSGMAPYQRGLAFELYRSSRAYRIRDERQTELRLIERGYGWQLLAFMRYAQAIGYTFCREDGLAMGEVARLLKHRRRPS